MNKHKKAQTITESLSTLEGSMIATLKLSPINGGETIERKFNWTDQIDIDDGTKVLVGHISMADDYPLIDGKVCRVIHMKSRPVS